MNNRLFVFVQDLVAVEFSLKFLWADQLIDIVLLIFSKCLEGRSFQFEDFSHKLPKYKLITWERLLKTFINAAILRDVRIYSWFARDVTKNQTKKLSIILSFYFHEVLQ